MLYITQKHKTWKHVFIIILITTEHYVTKGVKKKQHAAACYVLLLVCTVAACIWRRKPWCSQGGSSGRVFLLCESMNALSTSPDCWKTSDTPGKGNFSSASHLFSFASPWAEQVWPFPGCGHGGPGFPWPWHSKAEQLHGQKHSGQLALMQLFYPVLFAQRHPESGACKKEKERERVGEREREYSKCLLIKLVQLKPK